MGVNAAGLGSKMMTFKKVVSELQPSVFLIEETKFKDSGKFKEIVFFKSKLIRLSNYPLFDCLKVSRRIFFTCDSFKTQHDKTCYLFYL